MQGAPGFQRNIQKSQSQRCRGNTQFDSRLPVIPVRALKNKGTTQFGKLQLEIIDRLDRGAINPQQAQFEVENFWAGALREAAIEGKVHSGSLMAGQSVGLADKVMPVKDIIAELIQDAETELQRLHQLFHATCT